MLLCLLAVFLLLMLCGSSSRCRGMVSNVLFIQYFKRVALLAKLASLPSGPQQTKTILHINTIYNMYMDTSEFKRVKDAIKHITNVFCKIIRNKSKDAMSKTLKYKFKIWLRS